MATYDADLYALSKYGTPLAVDYGVAPFTAEPIGNGRTRVQWTNPTGAWTQFRLLGSRYGWATAADDGDVLLDLPGPTTPGQFIDIDGTTPALSAFRYYTLYLLIDGTWQRAGMTSTLAVSGDDTLDTLLSFVPTYFRLQAPSELTGHVENADFTKFMSVVAFGVNYLRSYAKTLPSANDPQIVHLSALESLSTQFGVEYLYALSARLMRQRVINASLLAKQRGLKSGLRDLIGLSSGFDIEIALGRNLMLNQDQSSFYNPIQYPEWSALRQYVGPDTVNNRPGDRVIFAGNEFEAKAPGALGDVQKPPVTAADNTWWKYINRHADGTLFVAKSASISTWQALLQGPEVPLTCNLPVDSTDPLYVNVGVSFDNHAGRNDSNVLVVRNTSGGTRDVLVRSISYLSPGGTTWDPETVVRYGIPVPQATEAWDPETEYLRGDIVMHMGRPWRAVRAALGAQPPGEPDFDDVWEALGFDGRIRMCFSAYAHGPLTGTAGTGGLAVESRVSLFDEHGQFLTTLSAKSTAAFLDTFTRQSTGVWTTRVADVRPAAQTWNVVSGSNWMVANGLAYPTNPAATQITRITGLAANGRVAVTFGKNAMTGHTHGLAVRISDGLNYIRASRSRLEKVAAGVVTTLATFASPFVEGDRLMLDLNASTITVYRNGVQIAQVTDALNSAIAQHGIFNS
jgi:hypothetical protein